MSQLNTVEAIQGRLRALGDPESVEGMRRFGITPDQTYGVRIPALRRLGREIGRNHALAAKLWAVDTRETRILASLVAEPDRVDDALMEQWAAAFDYWEICDQVAMNLFRRSPLAVPKAFAWSQRPETFVKRAGFVLMAQLAVGKGRAEEETLRTFLIPISREADDNRDMVRKAINWALRQIGKHSCALHSEACTTAEAILTRGTPAAIWIARDALRELRSEAVLTRLGQSD
jgi:3-methyladenine DNA glycosylase AlkD